MVTTYSKTSKVCRNIIKCLHTYKFTNVRAQYKLITISTRMCDHAHFK